MHFNESQEEVCRGRGVKQPSPPRGSDPYPHTSDDNMIGNGNAGSEYARMLASRGPAHSRPQPSQALFVGLCFVSCLSISLQLATLGRRRISVITQAFRPRPLLSPILQLLSACMHASLLYKPRPLSLAATFPTYLGHSVKGAASFTLALRVHTLLYFIVATVSMPALTKSLSHIPYVLNKILPLLS